MAIRTRMHHYPTTPYDVGGPSRTQQHFATECDINQIMGKYRKTGVLPEKLQIPAYGDAIGMPSYQEMLDISVRAQASFDALPASLRKRFGNSPASFMDFVHDEENREEAVKLGLIEAPSPAPADLPIPAKEPEAQLPS